MEDTAAAAAAAAEPARIVIFSSPGMGHLSPVAELAKHLVHPHHFSVTLITQSVGSVPETQQTILRSIAAVVDVVSLPPPPPEVLPDDTKPESLIFPTINYNISHLRTILRSLSASVVALVVDLFGVAAFDVAKEVGIPAYMFFTTTCMTLAFSFHFPTLHATFQGAFKDMSEPLRLRGCAPLKGSDFPDTNANRNSEAYAGMLWLVQQYRRAKGIIVNTFESMERAAIKAFAEDTRVPPVYPVGPLVRTSSAVEDGEGAKCRKWLDSQKPGSVLYVSFGSGGTLTKKQMKELAWGLQLSGRRFLWVVKNPDENKADAAYFGASNGESVLEFLPDEFLNHARDSGLVVSGWAPQVEVLSHAATGGFLTHCGWNSVLESVVKGVPLIAWPLHAEQKMNAVLLAEDVGVALRVRNDENGLVGREEIARVIKSLFGGEEGKRLRARMSEVSEEAARALEEEGPSFRSFCALARELKDGKEDDAMKN